MTERLKEVHFVLLDLTQKRSVLPSVDACCLLKLGLAEPVLKSGIIKSLKKCVKYFIMEDARVMQTGLFG